MLEDDLCQLNNRGPERPLDRLESDVWRGLEARIQQRQVARRMAVLQGVVMATALLGSVAAGVTLARPGASTASRALLASGIELTPSTLLLGNRP